MSTRPLDASRRARGFVPRRRARPRRGRCDGRQPRDRQRLVHGPARPERLRQDHAAQAAGGRERPASGSVTLDGRDARRLRPARRGPAHRRGAPGDASGVRLPVLDIVLMGRHPHLGTFEFEGPDDLAIAQESLEATSTWHLAHRPFSSLSGGEKQRVVIASALAQARRHPAARRADRVARPRRQLDVAALLQRLHRERAVTMVMATHDLNFAASVCDTLVLMQGGRAAGPRPDRERDDGRARARALRRGRGRAVQRAGAGT